MYQLVAPLYHEDGDMVDMFVEQAPDGRIRICDHAMTLMRLSYSLDVNSANKERVLQRILAENQVAEANGNLFLDTCNESLYPSILQFAQTVLKVSNLRILRREIVANLFYDQLAEFVESSLGKYNPCPSVLPIPTREELEVDFELRIRPRPIYLFGVRDNAKARLVTITCQAFQLAHMSFKSFAVHEDFDALSRKDRNRITSAADKQFVSLDDFRENVQQVLEREAAYQSVRRLPIHTTGRYSHVS